MPPAPREQPKKQSRSDRKKRGPSTPQGNAAREDPGTTDETDEDDTGEDGTPVPA